MANTQSDSSTSTSTVWQIIGRLVAAAVVLAITAFFTPGFSINDIWSLAIAAIVLYVTQFFVAGYTISWMAAIIGALIYGVIDYFIPGSESM